MKHVKTFESFHNETLNEGKFQRGVIKTYFNILALVKGLPKLFLKKTRDNFLKSLKVGNKIIDMLVFISDNKEVIYTYDDKDMFKTLSDKYDSDDIIEIVEKMYKEDLNRSIKDDLETIVDYFESDEFKEDIKKSKPATIKKTYDVIDIFKELKKMGFKN